MQQDQLAQLALKALLARPALQVQLARPALPARQELMVPLVFRGQSERQDLKDLRDQLDRLAHKAVKDQSVLKD